VRAIKVVPVPTIKVVPVRAIKVVPVPAIKVVPVRAIKANRNGGKAPLTVHLDTRWSWKVIVAEA
jgi:hypothetical protein